MKRKIPHNIPTANTKFDEYKKFLNERLPIKHRIDECTVNYEKYKKYINE